MFSAIKSMCQTSKETKYARTVNGETIDFSSSHPCGKNGLLRINQRGASGSNLFILTHNGDEVLVDCQISQNEPEYEHRWKDSTCTFVKNPYWIDADYESGETKFEDKGNTMIATRVENPRGGNRLLIELRLKGNYTITVPNDMDLEVNLENANVNYNSLRKTKLTVDAKEVNICGDSGFSGEDRQFWSYYGFGWFESPCTTIVTKGSVVVPVKGATQSLDPTHFMLWAGKDKALEISKQLK
jgi:hypothetical protein